MTVFSKYRQNIYIMGLINQAERPCVTGSLDYSDVFFINAEKSFKLPLSAVTKLRNNLNMTSSGLPFNYELNKMLYQTLRGY